MRLADRVVWLDGKVGDDTSGDEGAVRAPSARENFLDALAMLS